MQQLLVPVDFSPASRNAVNFAARLAQTLKSRMLLFNAYMLPTPVSEVPYMLVTAEEMQKQQQKRMGEEAAWVKKEFGIEVDTQVRLGIASDEIRHLVSENAIDLVVMGMKGENGVEKMIGSTTTNVVRKIKTPVLIVPQDATYQPLDRIVYATDFSYKGTHHLFDPLLALIRKFSATVQILHITLSHSSEHPDTLMGKKEIEQIFQPVSHAFVNLEHSSVTQGVNEFLSSHPSSLLVMVAHRHTFFERIFAKNHTTAMAYETHLPLLVLQDKG